MASGDLLSIGAIAFVSGLSVPALRYYHEVGVLVPAAVDPVTGYRRYGRGQVRDARLICALRAVDLPMEEIRGILQVQDGEFSRTVLAGYRNRLA